MLPHVLGRADSPRRSPSTAEAGARPSALGLFQHFLDAMDELVHIDRAD